MGRYLFRLPDIGEGVAEAEITVWHVQAGDIVKEDQSLVDVMTDKATVDMTSPVDGRVVTLHGEVGALVPVGAILVELEVEGAGNAAAADPGDETEAVPPPADPVEAALPAEPQPLTTSSAAPLASPATRRRAYELGIALESVPGSGPAGRITAQDLEDWIARGGPAVADGRLAMRHDVEEIPIIGMRRRIAEKMQDAVRRIPHISYVEEIDVTELESLRKELNESRAPDQPKLTFLPFFMRALAQILPDFPTINARYDDEKDVLHAYGAVHVGIATQTSAGLMVPVVHHTESRDIYGLADELTRVTTAARDGTADRQLLSGSTITITSLGTLGGIVSTPIINSPEVAIIGPNRMVERPVVQDGMVVIRKMMNLSSSFDHRIVDGHDAARFVQQLKRMIEHPALIFMD